MPKNPKNTLQIRAFGTPSKSLQKFLATAYKRRDCKYLASLDEAALLNAQTVEFLEKDLPKIQPPENLFLILIESIANAVLHGKAKEMAISVRQRNQIFLVSFYQSTPLPPAVQSAINQGRMGAPLPSKQLEPGGLGFPIILKICRNLTLSQDRTTLRLWLQSHNQRLK